MYLHAGCNAVLLIHMARVMTAQINRGTLAQPARTIRFVLFTGEEQLMIGSWKYSQKHVKELQYHKAAIIIDFGCGSILGSHCFCLSIIYLFRLIYFIFVDLQALKLLAALIHIELQEKLLTCWLLLLPR